MRPNRCSRFQARWIPGQVYVDERAECLQVQSFARRISGNDQANLTLLDGTLNDFAFDCGEVLANEHPALASASVNTDRFS